MKIFNVLKRASGFLAAFSLALFLLAPHSSTAGEYFGIQNQSHGILYFLQDNSNSPSVVYKVDVAQFSHFDIRKDFAIAYSKMGTAQVFGPNGNPETREILADQVLANSKLAVFQTRSGRVEVAELSTGKTIFAGPGNYSAGLSEKGFAIKNNWNGFFEVYDLTGKIVWSRFLATKDTRVMMNESGITLLRPTGDLQFYDYSGNLLRSAIQSTSLSQNEQVIFFGQPYNEIQVTDAQTVESTYFQLEMIKPLYHGYLARQSGALQLFDNSGNLLDSFFDRTVAGTSNQLIALKNRDLVQVYNRKTGSLQSFPGATSVALSDQAFALRFGQTQVQIQKVLESGANTTLTLLEPNLVTFGASNELVYLQSSLLNQAKIYRASTGAPVLLESFVDAVYLMNPQMDLTWGSF